MTTDQGAAERPLTEPGRRLVDKLDLAGRLSSDISFPDAEDDIAAIEAAALADARSRVLDALVQAGSDHDTLTRAEAHAAVLEALTERDYVAEAQEERHGDARARVEALPLMIDGRITTLRGTERDARTPADYVELYRAAVLEALTERDYVAEAQEERHGEDFDR